MSCIGALLDLIDLPVPIRATWHKELEVAVLCYDTV